MKFANFQEVQSIVSQIRKHQETLKKLSEPEVTVVIYESGQYGSIMTIGADPKRYEHDYSTLAQTFINDIKLDLTEKIERLNQRLLPL